MADIAKINGFNIKDATARSLLSKAMKLSDYKITMESSYIKLINDAGVNLQFNFGNGYINNGELEVSFDLPFSHECLMVLGLTGSSGDSEVTSFKLFDISSTYFSAYVTYIDGNTKNFGYYDGLCGWLAIGY